MSEALRIENLSCSFGALQVTSNVSFCLEQSARVALIGPNGAGKTTLVNLITGALNPSSGRVLLEGMNITALSQAARVHAGLMRTFQVTRLFTELSVEDNVRMAVLQRHKNSMRMFARLNSISGLEEEVGSALNLLQLQDRRSRKIRDLAYGEQRLVEIALAVALRPKVLLLDEPAAGVPQSESNVVMQAIAELPDDIAILFIEHDMDLVFCFAQRILVLVGGSLLMDAPPDEVAADERVHRLYRGEVA